MQAEHNGVSMQRCIDDCLYCYRTCRQTAMTHCLELGGDHLAPDHFRLMLHCSELCRTAAEFMIGNSPAHQPVCLACAEVCRMCADSCEQIGDMEECVQACRACIDSCSRMVEMHSLENMPGIGRPLPADPQGRLAM